MAGAYDSEFNKPAKYMRALRGGPVLCGAALPSGYGSLGGIKTDHNMQVLTPEGDKLPRPLCMRDGRLRHLR